MMTITALEEHDYMRALDFLLPHERFCISLVARLRERAVPAYILHDDSIRGVFTFSKAGQLLHCLPLPHECDRRAFLPALHAFFAARRDHALFSVHGEANGTRVLLTAIADATGRIPAWCQRYDFMYAPAASDDRTASIEQNCAGTGSVMLVAPHDSAVSVCASAKQDAARAHAVAPRRAAGSYEIICCSVSMADALFPLQAAYEKEEVVCQLAAYNETVCLLSLKKTLREQTVYAVVAGGALVAKGGTNARGVRYVQLGGVYTVPTERGKGYASALIRRLVADVAAQGRHVALFVKQENVAAQRLYAACGFQKYGEYESAYF